MLCSPDVVDSLSVCRCVRHIEARRVLVELLQAGGALKLLSGAVPVVSGLGSVAAAALKAGDRNIQTR